MANLSAGESHERIRQVLTRNCRRSCDRGHIVVSCFVAMDFVWTHFVVLNPKDIGLGNGVMVVGGEFVVGVEKFTRLAGEI